MPSSCPRAEDSSTENKRWRDEKRKVSGGFDYSRIMKADAAAQANVVGNIVRTLEHVVSRSDQSFKVRLDFSLSYKCDPDRIDARKAG